MTAYIFMGILFIISLFLIWCTYQIVKDKDEEIERKDKIIQAKETVIDAYAKGVEERKKNEELKTKLHSGGSDGFSASLDLLHKYSKKDN